MLINTIIEANNLRYETMNYVNSLVKNFGNVDDRIPPTIFVSLGEVSAHFVLPEEFILSSDLVPILFLSILNFIVTNFKPAAVILFYQRDKFVWYYSWSLDNEDLYESSISNMVSSSGKSLTVITEPVILDFQSTYFPYVNSFFRQERSYENLNILESLVLLPHEHWYTFDVNIITKQIKRIPASSELFQEIVNFPIRNSMDDYS